MMLKVAVLRPNRHREFFAKTATAHAALDTAVLTAYGFSAK